MEDKRKTCCFFMFYIKIITKYLRVYFSTEVKQRFLFPRTMDSTESKFYRNAKLWVLILITVA